MANDLKAIQGVLRNNEVEDTDAQHSSLSVLRRSEKAFNYTASPRKLLI